MARDEQDPPAGDVHFVVGDASDGPDDDSDAGSDEQLDDGDEARGRTRLRVELGLAALLLLGGLLIARATSGTHHTPQATGPTSPAAPTSLAPTPTGPVTAPPYMYRGALPPTSSLTATPVSGAEWHALPARLPAARHDPRTCPVDHCAETGALGAGVQQAIQTAFPESEVERSRTVALRGPRGVLWYREIDVRVASEELAVQVRAGRPGDPVRQGFRTDSGGIGDTFVEATVGPWHVQAVVIDRLGGQASLTALQTLVHDVDLVTT